MRRDGIVRFVTNNKHKYLEASEVLSKYDISIEWVPLSIDEVQSDYLEDIVVSKVLGSIGVVEIPYIVEDTGLYIEALNGFPGPYASYVYKKLGLENILKLLEGVKNRQAAFVAVGAVVLDQHFFKIFRGELHGEIANELRGENGFGYDPIFLPLNNKMTLAEMDLATKNKVSHRGKLFREIGEYLSKKRGLIG